MGGTFAAELALALSEEELSLTKQGARSSCLLRNFWFEFQWVYAQSFLSHQHGSLGQITKLMPDVVAQHANLNLHPHADKP